MNNFLLKNPNKLKASKASKVLTESCPQGEIHSAFLWYISFNGIFDEDIEGDVQAFADDSNLIFVSDDYNALERPANRALEKIFQLGLNNKLNFNKDKTEAFCTALY